jgi:RimJ/RimL family protein N-acetyltransferase
MKEIKTERLILKPLGLEYLDSTHEYASDPDNTKYMIHLPNESKEETEQFLKSVEDEWNNPNQQVFEYAIILEDKHIGAVSLRLEDNKKVGSLGWILNKDYHGKGYATEAAKALRNLALSQDGLHLDMLIAHCDYRNTQSIRVMEKLLMELVSDKGIRRYKGSDEDIQELVYSLSDDILFIKAIAELHSTFPVFYKSAHTHQTLVDTIIRFKEEDGVSYLSTPEMGKLVNRSQTWVMQAIKRLNVEDTCVEMIKPGKYVVHYDNILSRGVFSKIQKLLIMCVSDFEIMKEVIYMTDKDVAKNHDMTLTTAQMFKAYLRSLISKFKVEKNKD